MQIGINLIPFKSYQGMEVFTENVLRRIFPLAPHIQFTMFATQSLPKNLLIEGANVNLVITSSRFSKPLYSALYQHVWLPVLCKIHKIDLLFAPSPAAPFFYRNKVVTLHDCAYDRFPEARSFLSKMYVWLMYQGAKYFARHIVTVSRFSRQELEDLYHIDPNRVSVICEAPPDLPDIDEETALKVRGKFYIRKEYFLYVGSMRPRKNLERTIMAFRKFLEKREKDFLFVMAGKVDSKFLDIRKIIERESLTSSVILTDFVTQAEKVALYKGARALIFPSLYEGFGLPVLEAQSLGVLVLTSNTSALPEVAGKGALYVNPYSVDEIANGMIRIAEDEALRAKLISVGFENVKRFSWDITARQLLDLFKSLSQKHESTSDQ